MIKLEDYNLNADNINSVIDFSKKFYHSLNEPSAATMTIAICNHGYMLSQTFLKTALRKYNVENIPAFGCNLKEGFKLCFIGTSAVNESSKLLRELSISRLHRINCVLKEIRKLKYSINLRKLEAFLNKSPEHLDINDLAFGLYYDNITELNKKNIYSPTNTYNAILSNFDKEYPHWLPSLSEALGYLNFETTAYLANIPMTPENCKLVRSESNIVGIISNTSDPTQRGWIQFNSSIGKDTIPGSNSIL